MSKPLLKNITLVNHLVPAIAVNLTSNQSAVQLLNLVTQLVEHSILAQSLSNCAMYGPLKAKALIVQKLQEMAIEIARQPPSAQVLVQI